MEYYDATGEHHLEKKRKDAEYSNREYWKIQRKRQTAWWEQEHQIQEQWKNKEKYHEKTQSIEKETEKQWGKHKEKDTKEKKIELIPKNGERRKQKNKLQLLINQ